MKKKIFVVLMLIVLLSVLVFGCAKEEKNVYLNENQNSKSEMLELQDTTFSTSKTNSETNLNSLIEATNKSEGEGGGIITVKKYRSCYYSIPAPFVSLVGKEIYYEWIHTVDYSPSAEKMLMPQFIQTFGITREQFDKANFEFAQIVRDGLDGRPCLNPKDYANQITDEIFNADIIFTFDDEKINEYYLSPDYPYLYASEFDEAVKNGEYLSQTEEWVDIEQMEAEINAKYGNPETTGAETTGISAVEVAEKTTPKAVAQKEIDMSEGVGGNDITTRKYRVRYYSVPYQFALLVGLDAFWEWDAQYSSEMYAENDKIVIKEFVQYFNISREDFDRANLEFAKVVVSGFGGQPVMNPKDYTNQEIHEIYNSDIIYTFDDEIINEYYLSNGYPFDIQIDYENAVADGTYETRTTDWVDIEQMEAEINSKYGNPETTEAEITGISEVEVAEKTTD